jgi:glucose-1-phosphate cytidylyltransferase
MKAVILAGGRGSRLLEETAVRPKPMVEIGGRPILWHIMRIYAHHGIEDFIVCAGYKGYLIKEYFANLALHRSDVRFDLGQNRIEYLGQNEPLNWRVTVVDTGENTMTGGRLRRVAPYLEASEPFCMTYGDGLSNVDIAAAVAFHQRQGSLATMTIVRPPARFGSVQLNADRITAFREKLPASEGFINGGFFVLSKQVIDLIAGDDTVWEQEPLERLAAGGQLAAYRHDGFWQPMDTMRDRLLLEELWAGAAPPWKVWA